MAKCDPSHGEEFGLSTIFVIFSLMKRCDQLGIRPQSEVLASHADSKLFGQVTQCFGYKIHALSRVYVPEEWVSLSMVLW